MQVRSIRSISDSNAAAVVVGFYPGRRAAAGTAAVMQRLGKWTAGALEAAGFEGEGGQTAVLPSAGALPVTQVVAVGLGSDFDLEGLRQAAANGRNAAAGRVVATTLHRVGLDGSAAAVVEGLALADYRFDRYRSGAEERAELEVELVSAPRDWKAVADRAVTTVEAVHLARDLVNEPSAAKAPMALARLLAEQAEAVGLTHEIWDADRLVAEGMTGHLGVGGGSHRPPCLLRLDHRPAGAKATLHLVGKGIVFDSGGLSLKQVEWMENMKDDMAGAAAVASAVIAIARLGLKVNVTGLAALAENMPGGGAQRPGDVLRIRNGKTIEVLNTDAEGRLVLADALSLAAEEAPDLIVDLATLTGACHVALGDKIAGAFGRDDAAVEQVLAAAATAGERVWRLPLPADYRPMIDSEVADMKNTSGRYGGAIGAALLLAEFVGEVPWVHLDIAGPAFMKKAEHYIQKGASGFGVRTLVELASAMAG